MWTQTEIKMCFFRLSESRQTKAGEESCFLSSRPRRVAASSNIDLFLKSFFPMLWQSLSRLDGSILLGLNVPLRLAQLGLALHIWCLELPHSSSGSRLHTGQGAGEQQRCSPVLPARHRCRCPSCPAGEDGAVHGSLEGSCVEPHTPTFEQAEMRLLGFLPLSSYMDMN